MITETLDAAGFVVVSVDRRPTSLTVVFRVPQHRKGDWNDVVRRILIGLMSSGTDARVGQLHVFKDKEVRYGWFVEARGASKKALVKSEQEVSDIFSRVLGQRVQAPVAVEPVAGPGTGGGIPIKITRTEIEGGYVEEIPLAHMSGDDMNVPNERNRGARSFTGRVVTGGRP